MEMICHEAIGIDEPVKPGQVYLTLMKYCHFLGRPGFLYPNRMPNRSAMQVGVLTDGTGAISSFPDRTGSLLKTIDIPGLPACNFQMLMDLIDKWCPISLAIQSFHFVIAPREAVIAPWNI